MEEGQLVAAILGPIYLAVGIGIFLDPERYRSMAEEFLRSPALIYIGGTMALAIGLVILRFESGWGGVTPALVTAIGWLATLKGASLLILPGHVRPLWSPLISSAPRLRFAAIAVAALGLYLSAAGYGLI